MAFTQSPSVQGIENNPKIPTNYSFQEFKLEYFFFPFLFDRQCYWLGGGRMVDPVWERYARRRKGLINGSFFRINVCYIKILKRDSSIWHFASYHNIYLVLDSMNSQEIEECLLFYSTLIQFHGKQVWNWLYAIALVFIHLWICNFPKTL